MRRVGAAALLGITMVNPAPAMEGHILLSNYTTPESQVIDGTTGKALNSGSGYTFTVWYGPGTVSQESLVEGVSFDIEDKFTYDAGAGNGGWYLVLQTVPTVETYSFQIRASGSGADELLSRSVVWQADNVRPVNLAPEIKPEGFGLVVIPEPTTFTLLGLGSLALLMGRRRR